MEHKEKWVGVVDKDRHLIFYICRIITHDHEDGGKIDLNIVEDILSYGVEGPGSWEYSEKEDLREWVFQADVKEDIFNTKKEAQRSIVGRII